jgi:hypothetical protein
LTFEQDAEIDLMVIPAEVTSSADGAFPDLERIDEISERGRKGPRARPVDGCRSALAESFVRTFVIVLVLEMGERLLLSSESTARGRRCFVF